MPGKILDGMIMRASCREKSSSTDTFKLNGKIMKKCKVNVASLIKLSIYFEGKN